LSGEIPGYPGNARICSCSRICSVGATAVLFGIVPTPAVAYLIRAYKYDSGIVISASHNSYEYNGIKIFNENGYKLPDSVEDEIEALIHNESNVFPKPSGRGVGNGDRKSDALKDYLNFLKSMANFSLAGRKVVLDCANGASFTVAPRYSKNLALRSP